MSSCTTDDCTRPAHARGLCRFHYHRAWKAGELPTKPPRVTTCTADGCARPVHARELCEVHYCRQRRARKRARTPQRAQGTRGKGTRATAPRTRTGRPRVQGEGLDKYTRTRYRSPERFDVARLRAMVGVPPDGPTLEQHRRWSKQEAADIDA